MRAVAIVPRQPGSAHLADLPEPRLDDVADGTGVLVEPLEIGVDGTDRELVLGSFGLPPAGDNILVIGHESLGRVVAVGPAVASLRPGDLVTATVRRPGDSDYDRVGFQDLTTDDVVYERGITRLHGYLGERYVDAERFLVPVPATLAEVGVLAEPMSVVAKGLRAAWAVQRRLPFWAPRRAAVMGAGPLGLLAALSLRLRGLEVTVCARSARPNRRADLLAAVGAEYESLRQAELADILRRRGPWDLIVEATGHSPMVFEAATGLARCGVLVLASGSAGDTRAEVPVDLLNRLFVGGNRAMLGTVNAHRDDFAVALAEFAQAQTLYPGWLESLISHRLDGLEQWPELLRILLDEPAATKAVLRPNG